MLTSVLCLLTSVLLVSSARAFEWQNSGIWDSASVGRAFDSGPAWFTAGPAWMMNALPGSRFRARVLDRSGGIQESTTAEAPYVGTLHDVFDVSLFGNVPTFGRVVSSSTAVQDPFWDPTNGTGAGTGTTTPNGTWSTSVAAWNASSDGTGAVSPWTNGDAAVFSAGTDATGSYTVTVSGSVTASSITFEEGTVTLAGTATPALTISGAGGITVNSTVAGQVSFGSSLPITLSATQSWTNNSSQLLSVAGTVNLAANALTITGAGNTTLSGIVSGTGGSITKDGAGTLTLSGANTYTGGTVIKAGTLAITTTNSALGTGTVTMDGGTLDLGGRDLTSATRQIGVTSNGGTFSISTASTVTNKITNGTGAGSSTTLTKTGGSSLTLNGDNSGFTGQWSVTAGTLNLDGAATPTTSTNAVTLSGTGGLRLSASASTTKTVNIGTLSGSGAGTITPASSQTGATTVLVVTQASDGSVSNTIADNGNTKFAVTKSGAATLTLSGANTYTGATLISGGTLEAANTGALGSGTIGTSGITVNAGGTLLLSNTAVTDRVNNNATVNLGAGTGTPQSGGKLTLGKTADSVSTSETVGALTLNNNSTIDFASTTSTSHFALTAAGAGASTLSATSQNYALVLHWDGTIGQLGTTGSNDRLLFANGVTGFTDQSVTNQLLFDIGGQLYNTEFLTTGGSGLEAVPFQAVPEPSTWIGAALALGAIGVTQRKRFAKRSRVIRLRGAFHPPLALWRRRLGGQVG